MGACVSLVRLGEDPNADIADFSKRQLDRITPRIRWIVTRPRTPVIFLKLNENLISDIPVKCVSYFVHLETLWLHNNQLAELPDTLYVLSRLKNLALSGNYLRGLPDSFGSMQMLEMLEINDNHLQCLPDSFGKLGNLRVVLLQRNVISTLPDTMGDLQGLAELHLNNNCLKFLPDGMCRLANLRVLALNDNQLAEISEQLVPRWQRLHTLHVNGNNLTVLPKSVGRLQSLECLLLDHNQLRTLPDSIGLLGKLMELQVNSNRLVAVPDSLRHCGSLRQLHLTDNEMPSIPESLGQLGALEGLSLRHNRLRSLPECIGWLTALESLGIDGNQLEAIPESVACLTTLQILFANNNKLVTLPDGAGNMHQVECLRLDNCNITALPQTIGHMSSLQRLHLSNNKLETLPESISMLPWLQCLDIDNNNLVSLPDSFGGLVALKTLALDHNKLMHLPNSFGELFWLEALALNDNDIQDLPHSFIFVGTKAPFGTGLQICDLHNNPWEHPPHDVVAAGLTAVMRYLAAEERRDAAFRAAQAAAMVKDITPVNPLADLKASQLNQATTALGRAAARAAEVAAWRRPEPGEEERAADLMAQRRQIQEESHDLRGAAAARAQAIALKTAAQRERGAGVSGAMGVGGSGPGGSRLSGLSPVKETGSSAQAGSGHGAHGANSDGPDHGSEHESENARSGDSSIGRPAPALSGDAFMKEMIDLQTDLGLSRPASANSTLSSRDTSVKGRFVAPQSLDRSSNRDNTVGSGGASQESSPPEPLAPFTTEPTAAPLHHPPPLRPLSPVSSPVPPPSAPPNTVDVIPEEAQDKVQVGLDSELPFDINDAFAAAVAEAGGDIASIAATSEARPTTTDSIQVGAGASPTTRDIDTRGQSAIHGELEVKVQSKQVSIEDSDSQPNHGNVGACQEEEDTPRPPSLDKTKKRPDSKDKKKSKKKKKDKENAGHRRDSTNLDNRNLDFGTGINTIAFESVSSKPTVRSAAEDLLDQLLSDHMAGGDSGASTTIVKHPVGFTAGPRPPALPPTPKAAPTPVPTPAPPEPDLRTKAAALPLVPKDKHAPLLPLGASPPGPSTPTMAAVPAHVHVHGSDTGDVTGSVASSMVTSKAKKGKAGRAGIVRIGSDIDMAATVDGIVAHLDSTVDDILADMGDFEDLGMTMSLDDVKSVKRDVNSVTSKRGGNGHHHEHGHKPHHNGTGLKPLGSSAPPASVPVTISSRPPPASRTPGHSRGGSASPANHGHPHHLTPLSPEAIAKSHGSSRGPPQPSHILAVPASRQPRGPTGRQTLPSMAESTVTAPSSALQQNPPVTAPSSALQQNPPVTAPSSALQQNPPVTAPSSALQQNPPVTAPSSALQQNPPVTAPSSALQQNPPVTAPSSALQQNPPVTAPSSALQQNPPVHVTANAALGKQPGPSERATSAQMRHAARDRARVHAAAGAGTNTLLSVPRLDGTQTATHWDVAEATISNTDDGNGHDRDLYGGGKKPLPVVNIGKASVEELFSDIFN